jgi:hypothetical protein
MAKKGNAKIVEVKGSHLVFVSQSDAVANVIDSAANGIQSSK